MWFFLKDTYIQNTGNLPDSFTLKVSGDYTSSGAGRDYSAELVFDHNILISGSQSYAVTPGSCPDGTLSPCNYKIECIVENHQWVDISSKKECTLSFSIYSKEVIEQRIKSGELKSMDKCNHRDNCYKIIK